MSKNTEFAVLLVNLGTPDEPTPKAVRRYLREFLWDKRVVDAPRWLWWLVLNGVILLFRPRKVARLYASVWKAQGSPLLHYTRQLAEKLQTALTSTYGTPIPVIPTMTYGNPSIASAIQQLEALNVKKLIVLPLYPQYSATTTAASFDAIAKQFKLCRDIPEIIFIRDYYQCPEYIDALKQSVEQAPKQENSLLVISFHGIPLRYKRLGDPYPHECEETAQRLATALQLKNDQWILTFQSRFGREEWLQPYTDKTLEELPAKGIKHLQIMCPGFAVDCLETLEEIQEENQEVFKDAGGESYTYIPCLNDTQAHVSLLEQLIKTKAAAFSNNN